MATVYGEFYWDDESAKSVSVRWARRNRRFMWDYQHLSDKDGRPDADGKPTPMASVHDRRSAGDGAAQADAQGFHLLGQHWTPDADGYIRRREYLYFSPVLAIDEESNPPGRILDVIKSSLTDQGVKGKGAEGAIVANVPADLAKPSAAVAGGTDGKTFELTDMHRNLIRDLNREMPAGSKQLTEVQLSEVLAKSQRPTEQPKMRNPTA